MMKTCYFVFMARKANSKWEILGGIDEVGPISVGEEGAVVLHVSMEREVLDRFVELREEMKYFDCKVIYRDKEGQEHNTVMLQHCDVVEMKTPLMGTGRSDVALAKVSISYDESSFLPAG